MGAGPDEHDTTPRLIREHPTAQEPPGFWTLLGALAWIGSRDKRLVAAVELEQWRWAGEPELMAMAARDLWETDIADDFRYYCAPGEPSRQRFNEAVRELMRCLQDGRLKASGFKVGEAARGEPRTIDFADAQPSFSGSEGFLLLLDWGSLQVHSNDLFSLWPPKDKGVRAFAGAQDTTRNKRRGRPVGAGGFKGSDPFFIRQMRQLILENKVMLSPWRAALEFAVEAGGASIESTQKRLVALYKKTYQGSSD